MGSILRRKGTAMNRRGSITQLFNLQKPSLSIFQEQPTRYYDFVDTPVYHGTSSYFIDRQNITPELESDIRYACSLLVYRIERGVPSPPANQSSKPSSQIGCEKGKHSEAASEKAVPQIDSKYFSPKVGAEVAAMKDKYDSGVGLTQQPSRQTMRLLQSSHSDERSDSDGRAPESLFSQVRSTTSGSDTSYAEDPSSHSPVKISRQDRKQSMMGSSMGDDHTKGQDTMSFLAGTPKPGPSVDDASDVVEVFLNPDAALEPSGIPSFTSPSTHLSTILPSFGVSSDFPPNRQSQLMDQSRFLGDRPASRVDSSQSDKHDHEPGIIIDTNGVARVLSASEEVQRNIDLQQAVMAKMGAGAVGSNTDTSMPSPTQTSPHENHLTQPQSMPSRLQTSWSSRGKTATSKWRSATEVSPSLDKPNFFQKIVGFLRKRKDLDQGKEALAGEPLGIAQ
ncbi:hypothetical protein ETB97_001690 [Aspergillus alliaceus]|uniref:Uncharacterized protein n=1 Tax=Petromyces alliaceus TaxID=209559 RepID=A0A8H6A5M6_PETAA|nr:hypothetical protein ETB97_001690 [Aspergillus burnettii]